MTGNDAAGMTFRNSFLSFGSAGKAPGEGGETGDNIVAADELRKQQ